jgi:hypothetical protein
MNRPEALQLIESSRSRLSVLRQRKLKSEMGKRMWNQYIEKFEADLDHAADKVYSSRYLTGPMQKLVSRVDTGIKLLLENESSTVNYTIQAVEGTEAMLVKEGV